MNAPNKTLLLIQSQLGSGSYSIPANMFSLLVGSEG